MVLAGKSAAATAGANTWLFIQKTGFQQDRLRAHLHPRHDIVLRLFLNNIDKHRAFIERAPGHVKEVFTNGYGRCKHCHNEKDEGCRFRKTYTIRRGAHRKMQRDHLEFPRPFDPRWLMTIWLCSASFSLAGNRQKCTISPDLVHPARADETITGAEHFFRHPAHRQTPVCRVTQKFETHKTIS